MNKKVFALAAIVTIPLCGCFNNSKSGEIKSLAVDGVLCSIKEDGVKTSQQISYRVVEGEELLPYFTLESYFGLLDDYLKPGWKVNIEKTLGIYTVSVNAPNNEAYYIVNISPNAKTFQGSGDMSYAFTTEKDLSKSSLYLPYNGNSVLMGDVRNIKKFSYADLDFRVFNVEGKTYFPLSLLDINFSPMTSIHHMHNYQRLVQYLENKQLETEKYLVDGNYVTAYGEMNDYIDNVMKGIMPLYLRKDRKAAFLYIMENLYGLKQTRNISSMREYLEKQAFFADFLDESGEKRREAFCNVFKLLDDGHTNTRDLQSYPWYKGTINSYGPKLINMIDTNRALTASRLEAGLNPGEIYYSSDKKMAFFTFDSFTFVYDAFKEGDTMKEGLSDYHSVDYDSYFYIARLLKEIKAKGGVEDVIIDISTNGGGTVGVLVKILALLSEENRGTAYFYSDVLHATQSMYCSVDSNNDGVYNREDVFGCDFNFHILTSSFSFSCGNLFPFAAKYDGFASIIGQRSGGGECSVAEAYLPSGEHFSHSSNLHLGWYTGAFLGDEGGTPVDKEINYEDFFNLDKLQTIIG